MHEQRFAAPGTRPYFFLRCRSVPGSGASCAQRAGQHVGRAESGALHLVPPRCSARRRRQQRVWKARGTGRLPATHLGHTDELGRAWPVHRVHECHLLGAAPGRHDRRGGCHVPPLQFPCAGVRLSSAQAGRSAHGGLGPRRQCAAAAIRKTSNAVAWQCDLCNVWMTHPVVRRSRQAAADSALRQWTTKAASGGSRKRLPADSFAVRARRQRI